MTPSSNNPQQQMKMFGDMASFIAAVAAAAANNTSKAGSTTSTPTTTPIANPSSLLSMANLMQPDFNNNNTNSSTTNPLSAFKYNSLYPNQTHPPINFNQNQHPHITYTTSLAKYMSHYYKQPVEYFQRLLAQEQVPMNSSHQHDIINSHFGPQYQAKLAANGMRYHPYVKTDNINSTKQQQQHQPQQQQQHSAMIFSPQSNGIKVLPKSTPQLANSRSPSPSSSSMQSPKQTARNTSPQSPSSEKSSQLDQNVED